MKVSKDKKPTKAPVDPSAVDDEKKFSLDNSNAGENADAESPMSVEEEAPSKGQDQESGAKVAKVKIKICL